MRAPRDQQTVLIRHRAGSRGWLAGLLARGSRPGRRLRRADQAASPDFGFAFT